MDYCILEARSSKELVEKVKAKIEEGWLLQGGISLLTGVYVVGSAGILKEASVMAGATVEIIFAQAMSKSLP